MCIKMHMITLASQKRCFRFYNIKNLISISKRPK